MDKIVKKTLELETLHNNLFITSDDQLSVWVNSGNWKSFHALNKANGFPSLQICDTRVLLKLPSFSV